MAATGEGEGEDETTPVSEEQRKMSIIPATDTGEERETWGKKVDFLLSVIGFAVDLANVWRFPYLCYKNGGGAFLIPYGVMLLLGGIPLFFMELALGQYNRKGAITCWGRLVPLFKGVGFAVVCIAFYVDFFYNVILAWSLRYLFASFATELPWAHCNNTWNTPACQEIMEDANIYEEETSYDNVSLLFSSSVSSSSSSSSASASGDFSSGDSSSTSTAASSSTGILLDGEFVRPTSPAQEYWLRKVLQQDQSLGLNDLGSLQWETALCLLAVYLICYFSIWKGISTSGKVVWFTALFPYVVLLILLIRGVTLPGAIDGIHYYLKADFSKIWSSEVWVDAATQIFFSLGPGLGVLLAFASYNKFHNNIYKDALVTSTINCLTSFVSGFVIFSVLGYMSKMSGNDIANVVDQGPGLVFVAYPMALATMPWSSFFAIIFFMMLLTLGLDSSFAGSEAVVTALSDEFPVIGRNREIFVACLFAFDFLVGLACCTQGGYYVFQVFETYAAGISILFAVFCEAIAIAYIYGIPRLFEDVKEMIGFSPGIYWRTSIKYFGPFFIGFIIINGLVSHKPLSSIDSEKFPWWTDWLGWTMAGSSMLLIPGVAIYKICTTKGTFTERIRYLCIPWRDQQVTTSNGVTVDSDQVKLNSPIGNAHQV
ncbi:UNVERIFIED_CONTAM: hypothetical protein RMT77_008660 [Armadillidium vulgare]